MNDLSTIDLMISTQKKQRGINLTEAMTTEELDSQFEQLAQSQGILAASEALAAASLRAVNRNHQQPVLRLLSARCFSPDNVGGLSAYLRFKCGKAVDVEMDKYLGTQSSGEAKDRWLNLLEAEKLMNAKHVEEALAIFRAEDPMKLDSGGAFETQRAVAFANALVADNKHRWAQRMLEVALEKGGDRAFILHAKGIAARARGDRLLAASCFLDAVEEDAGCLPAYVGLQFALDNFEKLWDWAAMLLEKIYGSGDEKIPKTLVASALHRVYELRGDIASATALNRKFVEQTTIEKTGGNMVLRSKEPRLDFVIVGASKCGTSSLFSWLGQHPKSMLPHTKEINFFNGDRYANGLDWYLSHFAPLCDDGGYFTGESSPVYFGQTDISSERIRRCLTSVKVIILLRNPADRTLSAYHHEVKIGRMKRPRREAIQLWCDQYVGGGQHNAVAVSVYAPRVRKWFSVFGRENCLVINADQLFMNPESVMPSLFQYLQVEPVSMSYGVANAGTYQKDQEFEQERQELLRFFEPSIRELEQLLGYDMGWLVR